eukprot:gene27381-4685_t
MPAGTFQTGLNKSPISSSPSCLEDLPGVDMGKGVGEIQPGSTDGGKGVGEIQPGSTDGGKEGSAVNPPALLSAPSAVLASMPATKTPTKPATNLGKALQSAMQFRKFMKAEEEKWPRCSDHLSASVLHIPQHQVAALKLLASNGNPHITTNDAVAALVWVAMCQLRGRPLPGHAPQHPGHAGRARSCQVKPGCARSCTPATQQPGCADQQSSRGCFGLAIDLRRNVMGQQRIPAKLFANAVWCLHVPSVGLENVESTVTHHHTSSPESVIAPRSQT